MNSFDVDLAAWQPFFAAQLGAGAALLGLIFVGLSLNLARIVADSVLPRRAQIALLLLMLQLVVSSIALIPDQGRLVVGGKIVLASGTAWAVCLWVSLPTLRTSLPAQRVFERLAFLLLQVALLPYIAAGSCFSPVRRKRFISSQSESFCPSSRRASTRGCCSSRSTARQARRGTSPLTACR